MHREIFLEPPTVVAVANVSAAAVPAEFGKVNVPSKPLRRREPHPTPDRVFKENVSRVWLDRNLTDYVRSLLPLTTGCADRISAEGRRVDVVSKTEVANHSPALHSVLVSNVRLRDWQRASTGSTIRLQLRNFCTRNSGQRRRSTRRRS
jgi:hypothetical protein